MLQYGFQLVKVLLFEKREPRYNIYNEKVNQWWLGNANGIHYQYDLFNKFRRYIKLSKLKNSYNKNYF